MMTSLTQEEIETSFEECINLTCTKARNYYLLLLKEVLLNLFTFKFWQEWLDLP